MHFHCNSNFQTKNYSAKLISKTVQQTSVGSGLGTLIQLLTTDDLVLGDYFFLSQHEALGAVGDVERLSIGLYAVSSTMCVLLFEVLHDHILRLEHAIERAEQHHHSVHLQLEDGAPVGA